MDSCHIFNILFGTKKATSELSKCFSSVVGERSAKKSKSKANSDANPTSTSTSNSASSSKIEGCEAPVSPLRQLQTRLASLAKKSPAERKPKVGCDSRCGTYRATLVQSAELEFESELLSELAAKRTEAQVECARAEVEQPRRSEARKCKQVVLYDESRWEEERSPTIVASADVYNIVSEFGEARAKLRCVGSLGAHGQSGAREPTETESETETETESHDKRPSEASWRDKRSVYVQSLVQSFESSASSAGQATVSQSPRRKSLLEARSGGYSKPVTLVKPLPPKTPPKSNKAKCLNIQLSLNKPTKIKQLFEDESFLARFFHQLQPIDRCAAAQVCRLWRSVLYKNPNYWTDLVNVIDCNQLRREQLVECIMNTLHSAKLRHQQSRPAKLPAVRSSSRLDQEADEQANRHSSTDSYLDIDQDDVWRIQELCNRFSQRALSSRQQVAHQTEASEQPNCTASKSSSIPSQISSTLSSLSLSSLLSPLSESSRIESLRDKLYGSIDDRRFDAICLFGATDEDVEDLASKLAAESRARITIGRLNNCSLTNRGIDLFMRTFSRLEQLELSGCNEISNSLELKTLVSLKKLTLTDCINIADGIAQKLIQILHQLRELTIQAYHLTDAFLDYLSSNADTSQLRSLELPNCKEITNQSLMTIAKHFPQLQIISISGSTKISDDGIEILAEHARQLRSLDLSWCSRISNASLECIACDLGDTLTDLVLDRNIHITDIGLGYLATMSKLNLLHIRWCSRITDIGLESLIALNSLEYLSVAGLHQITARSLLCLVEAEQLLEVELTNCPAVNNELALFLATKMPKCNIIF